MNSNNTTTRHSSILQWAITAGSATHPRLERSFILPVFVGIVLWFSLMLCDAQLHALISL